MGMVDGKVVVVVSGTGRGQRRGIASKEEE